MKTVAAILFLILLCLGGDVCAQTQGNPAENLKAYFFVLLKTGPHRDQDSATAAQIQKEHMDNINKLAAMGKLNVAGPFLDDGEMRGIFIFDANSEEDVKLMVDNDPAVKAGRLIYEIHPWMTEKGTCFK